MSWPLILGQQRVVTALQGAITRERVAHAYLFVGPDGVGKRAVALAFAQALLCEKGAAVPCGACRDCMKVPRMLHPDVHVLFPQPKDATTEDVTRRLQRMGEEPYATIDFVRRPNLDDPNKTSNKQAIYHIDRVQTELRRPMSFKPVEGRYKMAILTDADRMRPEPANAFLKLLEEPTPQTVFVLTTSRPDRLLPTILSRCQHLRFDRLNAEEIEAALVERAKLEPGPAAMIARMADGSYSRALDLSENQDLLAGRQLVIDFFRYAYAGHIDKLADHVEQLSRLGRERVKGVLGLMLSWLRDLILFRVMGPQAPLVNIDQAEVIARFCTHVPNADLEAMVKLVESAQDLTERNVHLGLLMTVLGHALGKAMRGAHDGRLYVPLHEPQGRAPAPTAP